MLHGYMHESVPNKNRKIQTACFEKSSRTSMQHKKFGTKKKFFLKNLTFLVDNIPANSLKRISIEYL